MAHAAARAETLFTSPYFEVIRRSNRVVQVARTDRAFESIPALERAHVDLVRVLDTLPREKMAILVDLRMAPSRNDPEFEAAMNEQRPKIFEGFDRRAVLVRTAVGRLQVKRHASTDGHRDLEVFTEATAALEYLEG